MSDFGSDALVVSLPLYNVIWSMAGAEQQLNAYPMEHAAAMALLKEKAATAEPMAKIELVEAIPPVPGQHIAEKAKEAVNPGIIKNQPSLRAFCPDFRDD